MSKSKQVLNLWRWTILGLLLLLPVSTEAHFMVKVCNVLDYDLLTESGRKAYTDCQSEPMRHNTLQHIADTAWNKCKNLFGEAQCTNARSTTDTILATAEQSGQDAFNCVSDPLGCAQNVIDNLGLTDPNLGKMAILTGNITFETGGLLFSDFGLTTVDISGIDDTKVSDACKAFIALWDRTLEDDLYTVTTGGPYRIVVPACGSITYTIKPTNSLFTWNPPTHKVTVGAGIAASSVENPETETSSAGTIGSGALQQQQTETTGELSGQVTQEEQNTGKAGNSGTQEQEQQQNNQEHKSSKQINASTDKPEQQEEESSQERNSNQQLLRILRKK